MGHRILCGLAAGLALTAAAPGPVMASVLVKFANANPGYTDADTFVTFGGASPLTGVNNDGGAALVKGQSYSLLQLEQGVTISQFSSGRIYLSLGAGLTSATAATGYAPNFANPSLPDYGTRWDKVELTYDQTTQAGGANLTAQDFFGVPLQVATTGGQSPATLTWRAATAPIMNTLGALSNFALAQPSSGFDPNGAVVTGADGVAVDGVSQPVLRIISPGTVTAKAGGTTVYPSLAPYIAYLQNAGGAPITARIAGSNGQVNNVVQSYDFTVTIANQTGSIGGASVVKGDVVFVGTVTNGGVPVPTVAIIHANEFTDSKIYGASSAFEVISGDPDTNGVITHAVADYLSALNFGLVGSMVPNPNDPGHTLGESPSWTWYGNNPDGTAGPQLPITNAFAAAQPNQPYYNAFAADLIGPTDAYGFPYNDRLQLPLAPLDQSTTMTIKVLSDAGPAGDATPVPEPGSFGLLAAAVVLLFAHLSQAKTVATSRNGLKIWWVLLGSNQRPAD